MRQRVVYFAMILAAVTSVSAQEAKKWTLDDCIDYALEKISNCSRIKSHWKRAR